MNYTSELPKYNKISSSINLDMISKIILDKQKTLDTNLIGMSSDIQKVVGVDLYRDKDRESLKNKLKGVIEGLDSSAQLDFGSKRARGMFQSYLSEVGKDPEVLKQVVNTRKIRSMQKLKESEMKSGKFSMGNFQYAVDKMGLKEYTEGYRINERGEKVEVDDLGEFQYMRQYDHKKEILDLVKTVKSIKPTQKVKVRRKNGEIYEQTVNNLTPEMLRSFISQNLSSDAKRQMTIDGYLSLNKDSARAEQYLTAEYNQRIKGTKNRLDAYKSKLVSGLSKTEKARVEAEISSLTTDLEDINESYQRNLESKNYDNIGFKMEHTRVVSSMASLLGEQKRVSFSGYDQKDLARYKASLKSETKKLERGSKNYPQGLGVGNNNTDLGFNVVPKSTTTEDREGKLTLIESRKKETLERYNDQKNNLYEAFKNLPEGSVVKRIIESKEDKNKYVWNDGSSNPYEFPSDRERNNAGWQQETRKRSKEEVVEDLLKFSKNNELSDPEIQKGIRAVRELETEYVERSKILDEGYLHGVGSVTTKENSDEVFDEINSNPNIQLPLQGLDSEGNYVTAKSLLGNMTKSEFTEQFRMSVPKNDNVRKIKASILAQSLKKNVSANVEDVESSLPEGLDGRAVAFKQGMNTLKSVFGGAETGTIEMTPTVIAKLKTIEKLGAEGLPLYKNGKVVNISDVVLGEEYTVRTDSGVFADVITNTSKYETLVGRDTMMTQESDIMNIYSDNNIDKHVRSYLNKESFRVSGVNDVVFRDKVLNAKGVFKPNLDFVNLASSLGIHNKDVNALQLRHNDRGTYDVYASNSYTKKDDDGNSVGQVTDFVNTGKVLTQNDLQNLGLSNKIRFEDKKTTKRVNYSKTFSNEMSFRTNVKNKQRSDDMEVFSEYYGEAPFVVGGRGIQKQGGYMSKAEVYARMNNTEDCLSFLDKTLSGQNYSENTKQQVRTILSSALDNFHLFKVDYDYHVDSKGNGLGTISVVSKEDEDTVISKIEFNSNSSELNEKEYMAKHDPNLIFAQVLLGGVMGDSKALNNINKTIKLSQVNGQ